MQRRSSSTVDVKFFRLDYERVMARLREYAERVVGEGARVVILIGSLARGDYTAFSDADVIIVADNVPERPIDRIPRFIDPTLPVDLQPRVYTTSEFMEMARRRARIIREALSYGILLAGDRELLDSVRRAYSE